MRQNFRVFRSWWLLQNTTQSKNKKLNLEAMTFVASSILSVNYISDLLQKKYKLDKIKETKLLKAGVNHTYLIETLSGKFIFRVYVFNWRTKIEISEELHLLLLLKDNKIPVSFPITDIHLKYLQKINAPEGLRYGVLFSFLEGEKVKNYSIENHHTVGKMMASFHRITEGRVLKRITYNTTTLLEDSMERIKPFISSQSEEFIYLEQQVKKLSSHLKQIECSDFRHGIVHLDIWYDNICINANNEISFFDFDYCGNGLQSLDISYYLLQIHNTEESYSVFNEKMNSFIDGYNSIYSIDRKEYEVFPILGTVIFIYFLGIQCFRFNDWSSVYLNEIYIRKYINQKIKRWIDFYKI